MVVKPTVLYGAATWTMTASMERKLQKCQRRMLRLILGHRRRRTADGELQLWVDWIKRATRAAETAMENMRFDWWTVARRRSKWKWAKRVRELDRERWARVVADWEPQHTAKLSLARSQGRPKSRWADVIQHFLMDAGFKESWLDFPGNWDELEEAFTKYKIM